MYDFKKQLEHSDVHTAGFQKELAEQYTFPPNLNFDRIMFGAEVEFQAVMEVRKYGIKSVSIYTTSVKLMVDVLDEDEHLVEKSFEVEFDDSWKINDEHENEKVVGKSPHSIYADFNNKTLTVYYH